MINFDGTFLSHGPQIPHHCQSIAYLFSFQSNQGQKLTVARSPWRVKPDQGHQKLRSERPMCDYATEFRKLAV